MGWAEPRPEATAWYWDSAYDPHREVLLDTVAQVAHTGFMSVLEVGSHCGPNRRRLRERFGPAFRYTGLDINALAVSDGEVHARDDAAATFLVGAAPAALAPFPDKGFDLVISSGCLMCVRPEELMWALAEMRRLAAIAVICQEPAGAGDWLDGQGWAHRYPAWVVTC